jgi:tRNA(fMet)-specific endonuclease VapC
MNGEYLLDTSIIIAFLGGEKEVYQKMIEANKLYTSVIVLGELLYGALNSSKPKENTQKILEFIKFCEVLEITMRTAKKYAEVKTNLRKKGRPIPENDIWIASTALEWGLRVISRDDHFLEIDSLNVERW